jgi:prolyl-tRNA editing enzyme YbaK/EbsC (Cys-tRNA(Pro) deacylase)
VKKVDLLRSYLGQSRLTMAKADEVLVVTGYPIGAVGPFGTARQLRVLVDASVFIEEEISLGSGLRGNGRIAGNVSLTFVKIHTKIQ